MCSSYWGIRAWSLISPNADIDVAPAEAVILIVGEAILGIVVAAGVRQAAYRVP